MKIHRQLWILIGLIGTLTAAILPESWWRVLIMLVFTGFAPIALLRVRWSLVSLPLASLGASLPLWGLISLIMWQFNANSLIAWVPAGLATLCLVYSFFCQKKYIYISRWKWADFYACVLMILVGIPHMWIQQVNGLQQGESGPEFQARLYITNDSFYLFALAQSAKDQMRYPTENPFLAGYPNVYPSFLHCALGGLTQLGGPICGLVIWPVYPWLILPGIGLVYLALHRLCPRRNKWPTLTFTIAYGAFVALRVDHYLFPQTVGMSLPLLGLMLYVYPGTPVRASWSKWMIFTLLLLLLVASHTVTALTGLAIIAGIGLRQLQRKSRSVRTLLLPSLATAIIVPVFLWMNHASGATNLPEEFPNDLKWQLLKDTVFYYLLPFGLIPIFARVRPGVYHPFATAAWLLFSTTMLYWLLGYYQDNFTSMFFAMYNAPRFAINGLMLICIFYTISWKKGILFGVVFALYIAVLPNPVGQRNHEFITAPPYTVPLQEIRHVYNVLPKTTEIPARAISNLSGYPIPAFSGYAQTVPETPFYSVGTVSDQELAQLKSERKLFFTEFTPEQRLAYMKDKKLGAIVMRRPADGSLDSGFLPDETSEVHPGRHSIVYVLKP